MTPSTPPHESALDLRLRAFLPADALREGPNATRDRVRRSSGRDARASVTAPGVNGLLREPDHLMPAIHESGHAIVALVLRQPLIGIVLPAVGTSRPPSLPAGLALLGAGAVETMPHLEELDQDRADAPVGTVPVGADPRCHLIVLAAGAAAETRAGYRPSESDYSDAVAAEHLAALALRAKPYQRPVRLLLRRCQIEAAMIVDRRWGWITRTAQALEIKRRLTTAEILELKRWR